jgi:hypothetical protein
VSKRSVDAAPARSRRVHGDPKKEEKIPSLGQRRASSLWSRGPEGRSEDEVGLEKSRRPPLAQIVHTTFSKAAKLTVGRSSRDVSEAGFR